MCSSEFVPLSGGRCGCNSGCFQVTEQRPCEPCTPVSTSSFDGAIGVAGCQICNEGYFRPSDDAACEPCLEGAHCPLNSSLATIEMRDGFWRLSPYATRLRSCVNKSSVACLGGSVSGACAPAHEGPLCKTCISDGRVFRLQHRCLPRLPGWQWTCGGVNVNRRAACGCFCSCISHFCATTAIAVHDVPVA